jgi:hypothetical protein
MLELIKAVFSLLTVITGYFTNKGLSDAGKANVDLQATTETLSQVKKTNDIRIVSGSRSDNFFLQPPNDTGK